MQLHYKGLDELNAPFSRPMRCVFAFMKTALLSSCLLGAALCASAATKTWDGSSSGNWATAANWSGGVAPIAGDDLVFPSGVSRLLTTNNFSPNRAFNSIALLGSNYFLHG